MTTYPEEGCDVIANRFVVIIIVIDYFTPVIATTLVCSVGIFMCVCVFC